MFTTVTGIIGAVYFLTASPYRPGIRVAEMMHSLGSVERGSPNIKTVDDINAELHKFKVAGIAFDRWSIDRLVRDLNDPIIAKSPELLKLTRESIQFWQKSLQEHDQYIKDHPGIEDEIQVELQKLKGNK